MEWLGNSLIEVKEWTSVKHGKEVLSSCSSGRVADLSDRALPLHRTSRLQVCLEGESPANFWEVPLLALFQSCWAPKASSFKGFKLLGFQDHIYIYIYNVYRVGVITEDCFGQPPKSPHYLHSLRSRPLLVASRGFM